MDLEPHGTCLVRWSIASVNAARRLFTLDGPVADHLIYPYMWLDTPLTKDGELVCESNPMFGEDTHFNVGYRGNIGGLQPLPPRCYSLLPDGTFKGTNAAGCRALFKMEFLSSKGSRPS